MELEEHPSTLLEIVKNLYFQETPVTSLYLQERLRKVGLNVDSRTIRYHLLNMEKKGLVKRLGKRGVMLTKKGLEEAKIMLLPERLGEMAIEGEKAFWESSYDIDKNTGSIVANTLIIKREQLRESLEIMIKLSQRQIIFSPLIAIEPGPKKLKTIFIQEDEVALIVPSSRNYDLIFQKRGIPIESTATGILFIEEEKVRGFSEIMIHTGTTISPGELFIRGGYTSVSSYISTGIGHVTAAIKTFPSILYEKVIKTVDLLENTPFRKPIYHSYTIPNRFRFSIWEKNRGLIVVFGGANYLAPLVELGLTKNIHIANISYPIESMRYPQSLLKLLEQDKAPNINGG